MRFRSLLLAALHALTELAATARTARQRGSNRAHRSVCRRTTAVLLIGLAGAPGHAAEATPTLRTLTLRGAPNAYAEVVFANPVRLETSAKAPPRYEAKGSYAGAYIEPVRGNGPVAGNLLLRAMPGLSDVPFSLAPQGWLKAGRYRVHLLGDASTTVKIRVSGLRRDLTITTRSASRVVATWPARGVAGVAAPVDRTIVPVRVGRRTLTVAAETHESTGFYGRRDICVRERTNGLSPCLDGNAAHGRYWGVYPLTWTMGSAAAYHPGSLAPGELEVEFFDAAIAAPHGFTTFVLTLN